MTIREKFKAVFGVDYDDFENFADSLDKPYHKCKLYKCELSSWRFERKTATIFVVAPNKKEAREFAKIEFGSEYKYFRRLRDDEPISPMYKLTITEEAD